MDIPDRQKVNYACEKYDYWRKTPSNTVKVIHLRDIYRPLVPFGKETTSVRPWVAISAVIACLDTLLCWKIAVICNFTAQKCAMDNLHCPSSAVLCLKRSGFKFSAQYCTAGAHGVRVEHCTCASSSLLAQFSPLSVWGRRNALSLHTGGTWSTLDV